MISLINLKKFAVALSQMCFVVAFVQDQANSMS